MAKLNHCISCKEYYNFKDHLCSNCYKFKTTGTYSVVPDRESKLLNELQCKYINSKNLSFLIKLVTNNLSMINDEIYNGKNIIFCSELSLSSPMPTRIKAVPKSRDSLHC